MELNVLNIAILQYIFQKVTVLIFEDNHAKYIAKFS